MIAIRKSRDARAGPTLHAVCDPDIAILDEGPASRGAEALIIKVRDAHLYVAHERFVGCHIHPVFTRTGVETACTSR
jgi:hypothetical protein